MSKDKIQSHSYESAKQYDAKQEKLHSLKDIQKLKCLWLIMAALLNLWCTKSLNKHQVGL